MKTNKLQQRTVDNALNHIGSSLDTERGEVITHTIEGCSYSTGFWLTIRKDMEGLVETNLLRYTSAEHWHIWVGPRGATSVKMAPQQYGQFAGQRAFGMNFAQNGTYT